MKYVYIVAAMNVTITCDQDLYFTTAEGFLAQSFLWPLAMPALSEPVPKRVE
jgi:hypothetical protein